MFWPGEGREGEAVQQVIALTMIGKEAGGDGGRDGGCGGALHSLPHNTYLRLCDSGPWWWWWISVRTCGWMVKVVL